MPRWSRNDQGRLTYNAADRYDADHAAERRAAFLSVQLREGWALCPFCLRPVAFHRDRLDGRRRRRWLELHHVVGYHQSAVRFWRGVPVCSRCHVPKLHRQGVWMVDRHNPDNNRNTWVSAQWFRLRYLGAIVLAGVIREVLRLLLG